MLPKLPRNENGKTDVRALKAGCAPCGNVEVLLGSLAVEPEFFWPMYVYMIIFTLTYMTLEICRVCENTSCFNTLVI